MPAGESGDASRTLTPRGVRMLTWLGQRLLRSRWRPTHAFASPLARAQDSARVVLVSARIALDVEVLSELEPDTEPRSVLESLAAHDVVAGHALLVSHEPLLGKLAAELTGDPSIRLRPGMLVRIHCPRGPVRASARVALVLHPEEG